MKLSFKILPMITFEAVNQGPLKIHLETCRLSLAFCYGD